MPGLVHVAEKYLSMKFATVLGLLVVQAVLVQGGRIDDSTGFITPAQGVPDYTPSVWNRAYQVSMRGIPRAQASPFPFGAFGSLSSCSTSGYNTDPQKAPMVRPRDWWKEGYRGRDYLCRQAYMGVGKRKAEYYPAVEHLGACMHADALNT